MLLSAKKVLFIMIKCIKLAYNSHIALSEKFIKNLYYNIKFGTTDSQKDRLIL